MWREATADRGRVAALFASHVAATTVFLTLMNAATLFGYWAQTSWVPAYLALEPARGGIGLSSGTMSLFVIAMQVGMWFGYVSFGFIADAIGRKATYVGFISGAALLLPLYGILRAPTALLLLGPFVAFFGTGFFSGFSAIASELFPTEVRATAMGLSYNIGRGLSAAAPGIVGLLAARFGLGSAFFLQAAAFLAAALLALGLPETRGKQLD